MQNPLWGYIFGPPKEKKTVIELMQQLPVFAGCSIKELVIIERFLHQRRYQAGEKIFTEGEPGAALYIIESGNVAITKAVQEQEAVQLAVIQERSFFGEMALLDEVPRSASATCINETRALAFSKPDLGKLVERRPKTGVTILQNVSRLVCQRLVQTNHQLELLQSQSAATDENR